MSTLVKQTSSALDSANDRAHEWLEQSEDVTRRSVVVACNEYDRATLWNHLEAYLISESGVKSAHSLKSYRLSLNAFLDFAQQGRKQSENLLRPSRNLGSSYRLHLSQTLAPSSVAVRLAGAKAFYKSLRFAGATESAPFLDTKNPKDPTPPHAKRHPYSHAEVTALLEATAKPSHQLVTPVSLWHDRVLVLLMAHAGLRVFEAVAVEWDHIDFEAGRLEVVSGKGGKTDSVPLSPTLRDVLEQSPVVKQGLLLPFGDARARQRIKRLCNQAGITYRGCHSFRHYTGTRLLSETGRLEVVQQILRHADVSTSGIYAKMDKTVLERAVGSW
jgi:integrase/recombinase XerC